MRAQIDVLREVFVEWLRMHKLDHDFRIYTQEEWAEGKVDWRELQDRPESKEFLRISGCINYLPEAELIIAFENRLCEIFHLTGPFEVEEELQELAGGFGYYFEHGQTWNLGFYPLEDWAPLPPPDAPYYEKLKDPRWQEKRKRILRRSKNLCEECGQADQLIEVHHCYYRYGREPWQYPDGALLALCKSCHKKRQDAELDFRLFAPSLGTDQLLLLQKALERCQYWFDRDALNDFLRILEKVLGPVSIVPIDGLDPEKPGFEERRLNAKYRILSKKLYQMLRTHGHPNERGSEWPRNWL